MYPEKTEFADNSGHDPWRDEVASRVSSYRARRRKKGDGDESMRLDFDASVPEPQEPEPPRITLPRTEKREVCDTDYWRRLNAEAMAEVLTQDPILEEVMDGAAPDSLGELDIQIACEPAAEIPDIALIAEPEPVSVVEVPAPEPPKEIRANVIVFPRPLIEPPLAPVEPRYELAEPVFDQPRILDVPENIVPTIEGPLFADIQYELADEPEPKANEFNAPLPVALLPQRVFAAMVDALVTVGASALFIALAWKAIGEIPHTKPMIAAVALIPVALWAVYEFLFLVYGGRTLGMEMARLRLRNFDGTQTDFAGRKQRALFEVLSCASIGMGFLWALIDEDALCWHDRATRTFVMQE